MEVMGSRGMAKKEVHKNTFHLEDPTESLNFFSSKIFLLTAFLNIILFGCLHFLFLAIGPPQLVLAFISRLRMTRNRKI